MYDSFSADYDRFVDWPGRLAAELPFIERQLETVRDEQGEYQGTLEVTQDVTEIRALEGERRLLDKEG
jgi:signal transduction histidine kinase